MIDKIGPSEKFLEEYRTFNDTKKASFSKIINRLLNESFLIRDKEEKTTSEYLEALKKLRKLKIINFKVGNDFDGESRIFVYPSILYIVKVEDVENLNELIKKYQGENKDEEINED